MSIYAEMKECREKREEMARVVLETKENCCARYGAKYRDGTRMVPGGCDRCPLYYKIWDRYAWNVVWGRHGDAKHCCVAENKPLKEAYEFITKEDENSSEKEETK